MKTQVKTIARFSRRWICRATAAAGPKQSGAALDNRGFTLVEIIVVCAILGVLAIMAIPAFNDISLKAKNASAKSDLRTLDQAINAYIIDQNKLPNLLADIGMQATIKDPWKRSYQYFNIGTGTGDPGPRYTTWAAPPLNILNDDDNYDLYSLGPDGVTAHRIDIIKNDSSDDIVRANNGSTVELATEY